MKDSKLLIKYINREDIKSVENLKLYECWGIRDWIKYTKIFMLGFNKPRRKFFTYFLNCLDAHYQMYLVYDGLDVVGCFALRNKGRKTVYLYDFTVLTRYRGQGFSKKILNLIYATLIEKGKKKLCLYVKKSNDIAFNLYKSEGFVDYIYEKHK